MAEEEIHRINRQLEKMLDSSKFDESITDDLLNNLVETKVTLSILTNTNIGKTINNLRRVSQNKEINAKAKNLLKKWKQLIPAEKPGTNTSSRREDEFINETSNSSTNKSQTTQEVKSDQNKTNIKKPTAELKKATSDTKLVNLKASVTSDAVRLKCRELLANALSSTEIPDGSADPVDLGARIEEAIFKEFKDVNDKYKNRVRSRVSNLKDLKNPGLRNNVLLGLITPEKLSVMTAEEMASDALKSERTELTNKAINDYQLAQAQQTSTSVVQCKRCKQYKCSYTEFQTRSADEPMTLFFNCHHCGNRWKM